MEELAERIYQIIKDYQSDYPDRKFEINVNHILKWANQFEENAEFVLTEVLHFLPEIYISKERAKQLLRERLEYFQRYYGYAEMYQLILNTHFFT